MSSNLLDYTPQLRELMQMRGFVSFKQLSQQVSVSEKQINHLRHGRIQQMKLETLLKLSQGLGVSIAELFRKFEVSDEPDLKQEYQRLEKCLEQQKQELYDEFQQSSLQTIESWLLQWSGAAYAAQNRPEFPAKNLVLLIRPIEQLLKDWGVEVTETVGSEIPYDPQRHIVLDGTVEPGELVRVRFAGYRHGDRLLHRAKVSPIG
jgi:DNA-binding Xre family transcriptional regulator